MRSRVFIAAVVALMLLGTSSLSADVEKQSALSDFVCGMHVGGSWGTNTEWIKLLPDSWFSYLRSVNANWVGVSISMTVEGSMDRTIEVCGPEEDFQTFDESELRNLIRALRENGFHVYLTLAFEHMGDGPEGQRARRWQLGDPFIYNEELGVWREFWPWDPDHPEHESFVADFFRSYAEFAVRYGQLCQEEGVALYSLGTETDRLFRSRSLGSRWPTDFKDELSEMVRQVHEVYDGAVTYDMLSFSFTDPFPQGLHSLWSDVGMDAIGISAYFDVLPYRSATSPIPSESSLLNGWRSIFTQYLAPLADAHPELPILFLEFGYTDYPGSASSPSIGQFATRDLIDRNQDGLDDGEQEQALIISTWACTPRTDPVISRESA